MSEYIDSIISVLESIVHYKELLKEFSSQVIKFILPPLMGNIDSNNSDLRVQSLKFFSEICYLFYNGSQQQLNDLANNELRKRLRSFIETEFVDMLERLLTQPEPLPFFSLTIVESVLAFDITLIDILKIRNILPSLFRLLQVRNLILIYNYGGLFRSNLKFLHII
jgi:hypothetical protein